MVIGDCYAAIQDNLMNRQVPEPKMAMYIRKAITEICENYDCYLLQEFQPPAQFQQWKNSYSGDFFFPPTTNPYLQPNYINKIKYFYLFLDQFLAPGTDQWTGTNSGYNLTYRTIQNLGVLLNTSGIPIYWSRQAGFIWIAPIPDRDYWFQMCLQREHPFPNAGTPLEGTDVILLADSWQDIIEYAAAQRLAQIYNLSTKATELNQRLLGDSKFQTTQGIEGQPGLLFQRTSQEQRDQTTTVKIFRLRMGR